MRWFLYIQQDGKDGIVVPVNSRSTVLVGRHGDCQIRVNGPRVSRRHCHLQFNGNDWAIEDLDSRNGTKVNGKRVKSAIVKEGDEIRIGDAYISLVLTSGEGPEPIELSANEVQLDDGGIDFNIVEEVDSDQSPAPSDSFSRRYELGEIIHRGSTGLFYQAREIEMNRIVCIKILTTQLTEDNDEFRRFLRGVKTASVLNHLNIVALHDAGQLDDGRWWLAMEYVDGPSARQLSAEIGIGKMLSPQRVLSIARDIGQALQVAFHYQIVHRNITPDNILLTKGDVAKLTNFTLARGVVLTTLQQITSSNETVGELAYMAPERTEPGQDGDCRADIYGLGACLYTLLTGKPPFIARGKVELIDRIRFEQTTPPSKHNLAITAPLETLVVKCMEKQPANRFQSPNEFLLELERVARFRR